MISKRIKEDIIRSLPNGTKLFFPSVVSFGILFWIRINSLKVSVDVAKQYHIKSEKMRKHLFSFGMKVKVGTLCVQESTGKPVLSIRHSMVRSQMIENCLKNSPLDELKAEIIS